ncbi:capsular polysaccharide biosynthesis protein [Psychrobacter sp. I-STPA6b]|uniref:capsular polysaccharide biosynthesis protein n=1 Tax=Psychrobacter sp. I-STPA6b TaxID=2585718 RepID=UPI001D0BF859|nr:capsular polysaccharide biosynthesis protein [Psychrobacter sp. I-STPA6b]
MQHKQPAQNSNEQQQYIAVLGKGMIRNNKLLPMLLRQPVLRWYPWHLVSKKHHLPTQFAGWGIKKSYQRASRTADKLGISAVSVEDGFLRSLDSGIQSRFGCSVVVDDVGIYFDVRHPSTLEHHIMHRLDVWSNDMQQRAEQCIQKIICNHLSKYNPPVPVNCPIIEAIAIQRTENVENVLVIDQVANDASVLGAGANKQQFIHMLLKACHNHPNAKIYIKAHPAAKTGYLNQPKLLKLLKKKILKKYRQRIEVITANVNPIALLKQMTHVYTVSSHMGFEALMLGIKVYCFGVAWYTGWGLTEDKYAPKKLLKQVQKRRIQLFKASDSLQVKTPISQPSSSRLIHSSLRQLLSVPLWSQKHDDLSLQPLVAVSIEQLFYAAYIDYSRYVDPATGTSCEIEQSIQWLISNREKAKQLADSLTIYEFSRWKLPFVRDFLTPAVKTLKVKPKPRLKNLLHPKHFNVDYDNDLLVWGLAKKRQLETRCAKKNKGRGHIWCMEDGFIRSNGLGATLLEPLSVVLDKQGIYYDATQPSDLETLLLTCPALSDDELKRVEKLHQKLLSQRVSKYNVGDKNSLLLAHLSKQEQQEVILIVGQVEDDLSVQNCGSMVRTNAELIKRVRAENPQAYLIYKPHPDVEAGLRVGKVAKSLLSLVNEVAYQTAIHDCLEVVDSVYTISSQAGFEALLRHKKVVCYGLPFYAGWGLTVDKDYKQSPKAEFLARRQRQVPLTLAQMIYCTLVCYPLYRLPDGYGLAQVEQVIDYLYNQSAQPFAPSKKRQLIRTFMQVRKHWLQAMK